MSSSTTPPKHRSFIPQITLPRATTLMPWSITLPWVTTPSRRRMTPHDYVYCLSYYTEPSKYYSVLSYLLHRFSLILLCSQLLHRGSRWFLHQDGRILHRSGKVLICPDLHNHNWGGEVLRSPYLLHQSCGFVLRWTELLHRCPSLLHHDLRFTQLQQRSLKVLHRRSRLLHNYVRCPTSTKLSIALLETTTKLHIYCNFHDYVTTAPTYTSKFWSISVCVERLLKYKIDW